MRSLLVAFLSLSLVRQERPSLPAELDLAHDLGVAVSAVEPLDLARELVARAAETAGCPADDLGAARLFRAETRGANGVAQPCTLVAVPLAGPARGGRVVFSVVDGRAHAFGLWGALDFDADTSRRWITFSEQLRVAGTNETGATVGALAAAQKTPRELQAEVERLARGTDETSRLAYALLRQRLAMRRNGQGLAMARRGGREPQPEWLAQLAGDMRDLAELSRDLAPVLGEDGAARHAEHASDLADVFDEWHAALAADPETQGRTFGERMLRSCRTCHSTSGPDGGLPWKELCGERRLALGLAETRLWVGYDLAPAIGDDGRVSQEIATKVKAGILLAGMQAR